LRSPTLVATEDLHEEKYAEILCYPRVDTKQLELRIGELKTLGVKAIEFEGGKKIGGLSVLGKGCVSLVVIAHGDFGKAALKIRRLDANRPSMDHEAEMLRIANSIGVGPKLYQVTTNFLLMEFIDGELLPDWIERVKGRGERDKACRVFSKILEDCFALDKIGLDHGELSRAPKHILVDVRDSPKIIDFETASRDRRTTNVTSILQYLLIGSELSKQIREIIGEIEAQTLLESLREYKREKTSEKFQKVLEACGIGDSCVSG